MPRESASTNTNELAANIQHALNESARVVYRDLAEDYERHQIEDCGYQVPDAVAMQVAELTEGPVRILDVGAGTGMVGDALQRLGVDAQSIGVDLVEPMLRKVESPAYAHCVVADAAQSIPMRSETFDVAVTAGLMEYVIDPKAFLPELLRVVTIGGLAVVAYAPNRSGRPELIDKNAGLLSHDARHMAAVLEKVSGEIADRKEFNAYRNAGQWIRYESIAIVRH